MLFVLGGLISVMKSKFTKLSMRMCDEWSTFIGNSRQNLPPKISQKTSCVRVWKMNCDFVYKTDLISTAFAASRLEWGLFLAHLHVDNFTLALGATSFVWSWKKLDRSLLWGNGFYWTIKVNGESVIMTTLIETNSNSASSSNNSYFSAFRSNTIAFNRRQLSSCKIHCSVLRAKHHILSTWVIFDL